MGIRSLCLSTYCDHVRIEYNYRGAKVRVGLNPYFSTHSVMSPPVSAPYFENYRATIQDFTPAIEVAPGTWRMGRPVGPPHKPPPEWDSRTVAVGIPYWLITLIAAIIPSWQLARWWRVERKKGRGFAVQT